MKSLRNTAGLTLLTVAMLGGIVTIGEASTVNATQLPAANQASEISEFHNIQDVNNPLYNYTNKEIDNFSDSKWEAIADEFQTYFGAPEVKVLGAEKFDKNVDKNVKVEKVERVEKTEKTEKENYSFKGLNKVVDPNWTELSLEELEKKYGRDTNNSFEIQHSNSSDLDRVELSDAQWQTFKKDFGGSIEGLNGNTKPTILQIPNQQR